MARIIVIGAGMVGAACAYYLARDGHDVTVLDRGGVGSGTTSRGEGNILVSDKSPGPELDLALWSRQLWDDIADELGAEDLEWESKGGLVVAGTDRSLAALQALAGAQEAAGVRCKPIASGDLPGYEPHLALGLSGGMFYPDDSQVQPVRAAAALVHAARLAGATIRLDADVAGVVDGNGLSPMAVEYRTGGETVSAPTDFVVNAAGTWGAEISQMFGAALPILPRRGFVLVTEPLPRIVRHKVYTADYVDNVASSDEDLQTSVVVEGTRGGTILIGASRQRVGFDMTVEYDVVRRLAAQAVGLFPVLRDICLMRVYRGFRPYCPDHLPVIGPDPRVPGLWHACGHEGAGIGLAPATGALIADQIAGRPSPVAAKPFSPRRLVMPEVAA